MGYVPLPLLEAAVDHLRGKHVLAVLVLPAMLRSGVAIQKSPDDGTPYGSGNEIETLKEFFKLAGAPQERPFRAVWESQPQGYWRDERYPGRALQRIRTDRVKNGKGFFQKKRSPGPDLWALRPTPGKDLVDEIGDPVRIVDLAVWYGRDREADDLDQLVKWFVDEFSIDAGDFIGTIYSEDVPDHYKEIPFAPEPISQTEYAESVGGVPEAASVAGDLASLITTLEGKLTAKGYVLSKGFVGRVISAWLRGDIVVLAGQPGTGKTSFANHISNALREHLGGLSTTWVAVRPDFDEAELIGYERLDGKPELKEFSVSVLKSDEPLAAHLVVLDEFNVAPVETYLARVLIAAEEVERRVPLPGGDDSRLPVDTFILATCNSYLDEPETRLRVSYPTKRRASIITMPNVLYERFQVDGDQALIDLSMQLLQQRRSEIQDRMLNSLGASFDAMRLAALGTVSKQTDLSKEVRDKTRAIGSWLLGTPEGREFFTMGLLRDLAIAIALAPRDKGAELEALTYAIADKVVHQLRGPKSRADELLNQLDSLPGRDHVARLLDRMKSGPGDQLLPLV